MSQKIAVIAIGGNSLVKDKAHQSIRDQYQAVNETCRHIADMIDKGWTVAIGHGNGPQVGFVLRRSEISHQVEGIHEVPLDVCGADTQGATGYMLQQNLYNEFLDRKIDKKVATIVTQVEVDQSDPAFENPTKPIGSFMDESLAMDKKNTDDVTIEIFSPPSFEQSELWDLHECSRREIEKSMRNQMRKASYIDVEDSLKRLNEDFIEFMAKAYKMPLAIKNLPVHVSFD